LRRCLWSFAGLHTGCQCTKDAKVAWLNCDSCNCEERAMAASVAVERKLCRSERRLLARNVHAGVASRCLLLKVERTCR
jgi:hypothetical protein